MEKKKIKKKINTDKTKYDSWVLQAPWYSNTNSLAIWNSLIFKRIWIWHFPLYPFPAFSSSASTLKHFPFRGVWETRQMSRIFSNIREMWSKREKRNVSTDTNQEKGKTDGGPAHPPPVSSMHLSSQGGSIPLLLLPLGPVPSFFFSV